jgi:fatty-acyl-CoA synthase
MQDMILRGGENIYPKEIEDFLFAHPNIVDVQVVAIEDELVCHWSSGLLTFQYGEEVCACVIPKEFPRTETEAENFRAEIKLYCKDQISHFKIPRYIIFVDSFPLTITGKVQKFILKDIAKSELSKHKS